MLSVTALTAALNAYPELGVLSYDEVSKFIDLVRHLRPTLSRLQPSYISQAPERLPVKIHDFLMASLAQPHDIIKLAWAALRAIAWDVSVDEECTDETTDKYLVFLPLFLQYGLSRGLAYHMFYPPTRVCLECTKGLRSDRSMSVEWELAEDVVHGVTVFTVSAGAVPAFAISTYCRHCHTRYYHNYYVHTLASIRTYYVQPPLYVQVAQHYFVSSPLCELFTNMMVNSWTSATNCARIYNNTLAENNMRAYLPVLWSCRLEIDVENVWSGFFLHALLLDICEQREWCDAVLELQHDAPSQAERLRPALQARNERMIGTGQEQWSHACDQCCWISRAEDGTQFQLRSVVVDGVTLGHPCCGEHNCTNALLSTQDRYCPEHQHMDDICAVVNCTAHAEAGLKTCRHPDHRSLETYHKEQGKAMFQLKGRLERARVMHTDDSLTTLDPAANGIASGSVHAGPSDVAANDQEVLVDSDGVCDGKPEAGNTKVRARFGRRRTHNEELCVTSCGIILGRATFFGSEAPNGVRTFLMTLFPTRQSLPGVIWHDNNCQIVSMLRNDEDEGLRTYFDMSALPVDVFHFKSKHKEKDLDCGQNCNPYIWPELRTPDGKWRFNSSAAEQTNAWFGGFQAIVREMRVERYNFFLDEMVKRRNRMMVAKLRSQGQAPYLIPRHELLAVDVRTSQGTEVPY